MLYSPLSSSSSSSSTSSVSGGVIIQQNQNQNRINNTTVLLPTTCIICGILLFVYSICQLVLQIPLNIVSFNGQRIVYYYEYYRLLTNVVFHGNLMHILMNLLSAYTLLNTLEYYYGSIRLLLIVLVSSILSSIIHVTISYLLLIVFNYQQSMITNSIGFSSVLFHLLVLECNSTTNSNSNSTTTTNRTLFGCITVSSIYYPWILLIVLQIIIPNISFLGHFSGILVGTIQIHATYTKFYYLLPSEQSLCSIDNKLLSILSSSSSCCTGNNNRFTFIRTTDGIDTTRHPPITTSSSLSTTTSPLSSIKNVFYNLSIKVRQTINIVYIHIFGNGTNANENISILFDTSTTRSSTSPTTGSSSNNNNNIGSTRIPLLSASDDTLNNNNNKRQQHEHTSTDSYLV